MARSLCGLLLALLTAVGHAQSPNARRIGFLSALDYAAFPTRIDAFRQGLKELGYVDGKNIAVEYRWADGKADRLPQMAQDLEKLNVALIVSAGPSATRAALAATKRTPIIMAFDTDPVGSGFVSSLGRPGGRATGLSTLAPEIGGKQIDVLRQIIPALSRVAIVGDSREPGNTRTLRETERAAAKLGIHTSYVDVGSVRNVEALFEKLRVERPDALVVMPTPSPLVTSGRHAFAAAASMARLPAMYWGVLNVEAGGLMTYSVNVDDLFRRAATYVDKILKGTNPAELPVEEPFKFDLVINVGAAKEIGIEIPMSLLARADRVIQ